MLEAIKQKISGMSDKKLQADIYNVLREKANTLLDKDLVSEIEAILKEYDPTVTPSATNGK